MSSNQRSEEAKQYRRWYYTKLWKTIRRQQLAAHPLCARCLPNSIVPATVVHHVKPHKGEWDLFVAGPFESLCKVCHDSSAQSDEKLGYTTGCDAFGTPVDIQHHWNKPERI